MTRLADAVPAQRAAYDRLMAARDRNYMAVTERDQDLKRLRAAAEERRRVAEEMLRAEEIKAEHTWVGAWEAMMPKRLTVARIQRVTAHQFGMSRTDILSPRRTADRVLPRQIAMFLAKKLTQLSLLQIGLQFGGRHHTTILHGIRKIEALVAVDPALADTVASLRAELAGAAP